MIDDPWAADLADHTPVTRRPSAAVLRADDYASAREAYVQRRESATLGYAAETRDYHRDVGTFTLTTFLRGTLDTRPDHR